MKYQRFDRSNEEIYKDYLSKLQRAIPPGLEPGHYHFAMDQEGNVSQLNYPTEVGMNATNAIAKPTAGLLEAINMERINLVAEINDAINLLEDDMAPILMGADTSPEDTAQREDRSEFEHVERDHLDALYHIRRRISLLRERYALNK